jgi:hypothetical protein
MSDALEPDLLQCQDRGPDPHRGTVQMPPVTRLARLVRIVTLPETRGVIVAAAHSETLRDIRQRAVHDRAALVRDLRNPANARDLVRSAARHPAARELASAGLMFLPLRYLPVGWAATWVAHRVVRRHLDPPAAVLDASDFGAGRPLKNVTHEAPKV